MPVHTLEAEVERVDLGRRVFDDPGSGVNQSACHTLYLVMTSEGGVKHIVDRVGQALALGMAVPALHFLTQIAAAPFYPGYSFLSRDASTLGSHGSSAPWVFNVGSLVVGIVTVLAAWGFLRALQEARANRVMTWLTSLALVSTGLAGVNAFLFPLPDARHTQSILALFGSATFLLPALMPAVLWKLPEARRAKAYFVINIVVCLALIPIMSGLIQRLAMMAGGEIPGYQSFLNGYHGVLQRVAAVVVFVPIGVGAWILLSQRTGGHAASAFATDAG